MPGASLSSSEALARGTWASWSTRIWKSDAPRLGGGRRPSTVTSRAAGAGDGGAGGAGASGGGDAAGKVAGSGLDGDAGAGGGVVGAGGSKWKRSWTRLATATPSRSAGRNRQWLAASIAAWSRRGSTPWARATPVTFPSESISTFTATSPRAPLSAALNGYAGCCCSSTVGGSTPEEMGAAASFA